MDKKPRLGRIGGIDGDRQIVFELPPPRIISRFIANPDGTYNVEFTEYGKSIFAKPPENEIRMVSRLDPQVARLLGQPNEYEYLPEND